MKKRLAIFLDFANIEAAAQCNLDYGSLLRYIAGDREVIEAFAYVPIDPRYPHGREAMISQLQKNGFLVTSKMGKLAGDTYKANVDVEMTIDIIRCSEVMRPDILVLCSGDGDFLPLIRYLRQRGVRIETASFQCAASRETRAEANHFIDLDLWLAGQGCRQQVKPRRSTHWIPPRQAYPPMPPQNTHGRQIVHQQGAYPQNLPPLPPQEQGGQAEFARQAQNFNGESYFLRKSF